MLDTGNYATYPGLPDSPTSGHPTNLPWFIIKGVEHTAVDRFQQMDEITFAGATWRVVHLRIRHPDGTIRNCILAPLVVDQGGPVPAAYENPPTAMMYRDTRSHVVLEPPIHGRYRELAWDEMYGILRPYFSLARTLPGYCVSLPPEDPEIPLLHDAPPNFVWPNQRLLPLAE